MEQKSSGKSTTTESNTGSVKPTAAPTQKARPMGGMEKKKWAGKDMWECPRCGVTTFDQSEANTHTCNGRVARLYKGDDA